jgi:glycosyltransferase involved in cell wall biosynthesis
LLDRIYPSVRAMEPLARLVIVGRHPPEWLRRRCAVESGLELHGDVADVRPHLTRCGMLVVPLRIGGGSRLKILEALACGAPVVSTVVGAEGLHLEAGRHLCLVPTITEMAAAIMRTIHAPEDARDQAERGRQVVLEFYDWDALADQMERVWIQCVERRPV